jgi:3-oxoacyl-[acyl-carrier protein] reductase
MKLKDRVVIVTGGGSGIGAASAKSFAAEGARVMVMDLDEGHAKRTVEQVEKAGGKALAVRGNVTSAADNQAAVDRATLLYGRLDVFFANAGITQRTNEVENVDEAVFDEVMAVNVKGVFLAAKYALPVMKRQGRGVFIVTASTAALRPRPGGQVYAASKGAVVTFVKGLALEAAPFGVRVVALAPVATVTPMLSGVDEDGLARYIATVPLGRLNQPEDIGRAAVFLASDDAAMITGSCLEVDGGRCI